MGKYELTIDLIGQLVEHRTVSRRSRVVEDLIFSGFFIPIAKLEIHCDDHLSLSCTSAVNHFHIHDIKSLILFSNIPQRLVS